jgi:ABC-2 type transport system ATP-binding protein
MYQVEEMADRMLMISKGRLALYGEVNEVRQRYVLPAVIVEGQGQWENLAGVERVETDGNGRRGTTLFLRDGVAPDAVLEEIAHRPDFQIRRFELAVPSLNDIFIRVVADGKADRLGGE